MSPFMVERHKFRGIYEQKANNTSSLRCMPSQNVLLTFDQNIAM